MPNRRRRATATRAIARRRAEYLAARLGRALRESRVALAKTQASAAARAGVSQPFWSRLERGGGGTASLETLAACAAAVDVQLAAFIEARPGADLPRDIEHLRRQELVVRIAEGGGWSARPERPIDPGALRSRSIDVLLMRSRHTAPRAAGDCPEIVVVEIEDLLADVGDVLRGLTDKVAAVSREYSTVAYSDGHRGGEPRIGGLLIVRATRRNREIVGQLGGLFRTKFPSSSAAWLRALRDPQALMPEHDGFLWSAVRGDRLFPARLSPPGHSNAGDFRPGD